MVSNILSAVSTIFAYASTAYAKVENINPTAAKVLGFLAGIILYKLAFALVAINSKIMIMLACGYFFAEYLSRVNSENAPRPFHDYLPNAL